MAQISETAAAFYIVFFDKGAKPKKILESHHNNKFFFIPMWRFRYETLLMRPIIILLQVQN